MSGNVWEWCDNWYTQEYSQNGKSVHPGWPFNGTSAFSAGSCEVVVGVVLQKAAECHILTMTCQTIVMNMEVLGLF